MWLFAPHEAAGGSCPLTTRVAPFEATTSSRYEIRLTDGGPGDLDGAVNGSCETAIELCSGSSMCEDGASILLASARATGGASEAARQLMQSSVASALDPLTGGVAACRVARIAVPAVDARPPEVRVLTIASLLDGRMAVGRSRLGLRCLPATPEASNAPACRGKRRACPSLAEPSCGNGLRDTAAERCDGGDDAACPGACRPDCSCGVVPAELDVAPLAAVDTSSSMPDSGPEAAVDGVVDGAPTAPSREWASNGETAGAWLRLRWSSPVTIDRVILYDRPSATDNVTEAMLVPDDGGTPIATGALAPDGAPTDVTFAPRTVSSLTFMVTDATGTNAGLSEIQAVRRRKGRPVTTTTTSSTTTTSDPTSTSTTTSTTDPTTSTSTSTTKPSTTSTSTSTTKPSTTSTSTSTTKPSTTSTSTSTTKPSTTSTSTSTTKPSTTSTSTSTTTSTTLAAPTGPTYYISASGSDANAGTGADKPWKTFGKALKALLPGDTLIVADGKYTRGTTGLPVIDCANGVRSGTADKPITIRAANERKAWLAGDGIGDGIAVNHCSYWNIVGLRVSSADNTSAQSWEGNVVHVMWSDHLQLRRLLAMRPNRTCPNGSLPYCNAHGIAIEESHDVLVEESEVYDFHRHGISVYASRYVTVRRCYVNPWDAAGAERTGLIFYGTSDSVAENNVGEGVRAFSVAGSPMYDGTPGGYRNKILGTVTLNAVYGSTIRSRNFGGPELPTGHNLLRDDVFVGTQNVGVYARGAADTVVENVTVFNTKVADGISADEDLTEPAPCSGNPEGCSITIRNALSVGNAGKGAGIQTSVVSPWLVDSSNFYANASGNFPTSETASDDTGSIRKSMSVAPTGMGVGTGKCMLWAPDGSNMKGAGRNGADIGATVLYRYQDGVLTTQRLWDRTTGAFPCGAVIAGANDVAGRVCSSVQQRLNVNTNGCAFPASY